MDLTAKIEQLHRALTDPHSFWISTPTGWQCIYCRVYLPDLSEGSSSEVQCSDRPEDHHPHCPYMHMVYGDEGDME